MAKIRQGFVSNSSSSSFVIAVPKGTEVTAKAFHRALYGSHEVITFRPEYDWHSIAIKSTDVVNEIISQIKDGENNSAKYEEWETPKGKLTLETLKHVVNPSEGPNIDDFYGPSRKNKDGQVGRDLDWDRYNAAWEEAKTKEAEFIAKRFATMDLYTVEFADDTEYGCELEHGPALNNLRNVIRYSKH